MSFFNQRLVIFYKRNVDICSKHLVITFCSYLLLRLLISAHTTAFKQILCKLYFLSNQVKKKNTLHLR